MILDLNVERERMDDLFDYTLIAQIILFGRFGF